MGYMMQDDWIEPALHGALFFVHGRPASCRTMLKNGTLQMKDLDDLRLLQSMFKQVGSLADDLGMTAYEVGSPVDWVTAFKSEKAGAT